MLQLYRKHDCPRCIRIQETLEEMVLAHEVEVVGSVEDLPDELQRRRLPLLVDEGRVFEGADAIAERLKELETFKAEWEKFQSDACYCDDEGNVI